MTARAATVLLFASLLTACNDPRPAAVRSPPAGPAPADGSPGTAQQAQQAQHPQVDRAALAVFAPLPEAMLDGVAAPSEAQVELGRMLYYDTRLSKNHDLSCNSCHNLASGYGAEHTPVSHGHKHQVGRRNAPSVYNAAGHVSQFWDGRSPNVEHQATQPLINPIEMATNDRLLARVIASMPAYVRLFRRAFPGQDSPVNIINIGRAIGAFERHLVTPGGWDAYLRGNDNALDPQQTRGLAEFLAVGCAACHNGPYMGGGMLQKAGLVKPWPTSDDPGRFAITKEPADRMVFKVPSLRNVAETGPYFHDGSVADLGEAVTRMADLQLGRQLSPGQRDDIVAFLGALTGRIPTDFIKPPSLPPTSETTPRPSAL